MKYFSNKEDFNGLQAVFDKLIKGLVIEVKHGYENSAGGRSAAQFYEDRPTFLGDEPTSIGFSIHHFAYRSTL
jgi:hypothetical protein